ncbi:OmpH family outer membrane protein [Thermosulfuriphilus sp.]
MKKLLRLLGIIIALLLLAQWAHAQTAQKIAVIQMQKVVKESKAGQSALKKLNQKFATLQKELKAKEEELKRFKNDLEKKAPLLSPEARQEKERQYQKMLREYKAKREDAEFEIRQAEQKALEPIMKDLRGIVFDYAQKEGFDLIVEKNMPGVYFASDKIDITRKIIELYDQKFEKGEALGGK